jgi:acetyl-CoA acetyltransferase
VSAAYLYDAIRTPFGRFGGGLAGIRPDDLAAHVVATLCERSPGLDPARIDDVIFGNANSSPLNDGASALFVGDEAAAAQLGREPLARIAGRGVHGVDPDVFGIGPVLAAERALQRAGIGWGGLAAVELNEAFAAQSLACLGEWQELDPEIVNVNGGAIAIGHLRRPPARHPRPPAARAGRRLGPRRRHRGLTTVNPCAFFRPQGE